jgi:hypothetical protein
MTRWLKWTLLLAAVAATSGGCVTPISPLSSHTIKTGENQEEDVVWIVEGAEAVYRCSNTPGGPVCKSAARQ